MKNQQNIQKNDNLDKQILQFLSDNPGQKAREIAIFLNIEKKQVNQAFYSSLKSVCSQDEDYRWYLNKDMPNLKKAEVKQSVVTALTNLTHYYLACLGQDDEGGVSVFAYNKFGDLDYAELKELPLNGGNTCFQSTEAQSLLGKIRKDRSRLEMYLGYPTALRKVMSKKSNWQGFFVEPLLCFQLKRLIPSPLFPQAFQ